MATKKAFIKQGEDIILPITRAELVFDEEGMPAIQSKKFVANNGLPGLINADERQRAINSVQQDDLKSLTTGDGLVMPEDSTLKGAYNTKSERVISLAWYNYQTGQYEI